MAKSTNAKAIEEHRQDLMEAVAIHNKNNPEAYKNLIKKLNLRK